MPAREDHHADHAARPENKQAPNTSKKSAKNQWDAFQQREALHQLVDMVERLNSRSSSLLSSVRFELETGRRLPKILMLNEERVVNRFEAGDLIDLERSLYDMAGLHFSFET